MKYVYPKLSDKDFYIIRIGGLGLGNMLFTYAKAVLYARDHGARLIWPTWVSIPVGQILRRESNKRFYHDLFQNRIGAVSGFQKLRLLWTRKKDIAVMEGMEGEFEPIAGKENSEYLYRHFQTILQERNRKAMEFEPGNGICMHIRLGDFTRGTEADLKAGNPNTSIPIEWYINVIQQIRDAVSETLPVYIFSDGSREELQDILALPGVQQVTFGTAIGDILAMSKARLFVASGSTFSRWVRYLGRMNTITYPGQLKQHLLEEDEPAFEIEAEQIPEVYLDRLKKQLQ